MALNRLNSIAQFDRKPILKIADMQIGEKHPILSIKSVFSTKLRKQCIVCELHQNVLFLPQRFVEKLQEADLVELNKQRLAIVYLGPINVGKAHPAGNLKFVDLGSPFEASSKN